MHTDKDKAHSFSAFFFFLLVVIDQTFLHPPSPIHQPSSIAVNHLHHLHHLHHHHHHRHHLHHRPPCHHRFNDHLVVLQPSSLSAKPSSTSPSSCSPHHLPSKSLPSVPKLPSCCSLCFAISVSFLSSILMSR